MDRWTVGVFVIGSLYWEGEKDSIRERWRNDRLEMGADLERPVKAPIRYGRISSTRGNTYTMVFSRRCSQNGRLGQAKIIPCQRTVSTFDDLKEEAEELWKAERNRTPQPGQSRISTDWGCVALLINPASHIRQDLLNRWAAFVAEERERAPLCKSLEGAPDEGSLIDDRGLLRIPWPDLNSSSGSLPDILLATATKPAPKPKPNYPSEKEIAQAWIKNDHVYYFWCNYENDIRTFEDEPIKRILESARCLREKKSCR